MIGEFGKLGEIPANTKVCNFIKYIDDLKIF